MNVVGTSMYSDEINTQKFEFAVSDANGDDSYDSIGICERFGFGFIRRDTGYVSPLFGPEIFDIKKKYTFDRTELIELYRKHGTYYLPEENHEGTNGAVDILLDNDIYRYNESGESFEGSDIISLRNITAHNINNPVVIEKTELEDLFENGDALALWPLIEKAHR